MNPGGSTPPGPVSPGSAGERFPRRARIRRGEEIRRLLRSGTRRRTPHLDVFVDRGTGQEVRFGTIVPRFGRTIVERNRLKRRLRELGRREVLPALHAAGQGAEVLVRTRPRAYEADFSTLRRELLGITEALCSESRPSA